MTKPEEGKWYLAFITRERSDEKSEPITTINAIKPICFDTFTSDRQAVQDYHRSLRLIKSVQLNVQEFLQSIVNHSSDFLDSREMNEDKFDFITLNFTRLLLNILSMFRSLLDHSDFSISREFGKESVQLRRWKTIQSDQYDNFFEYRLFYKLRNYCQHIGAPPIHISFQDCVEQEGITFRLDIGRDILLEELSVWNVQLINDLKAAPEKIPVLDTLNTWSICFRAISKELLDIKREVAESAAKRILNYRRENDLPSDVGQLCAVFIQAFGAKPTRLDLRLHWLPEKQAHELLNINPFDSVEGNE